MERLADAARRARRLADARRRALLALALVAFLAFYLLPAALRAFRSDARRPDAAAACLRRALTKHRRAIDERDALAYAPGEPPPPTPPYVGNGRFGLALDDGALHARGRGRGLALPTPLRPLLRFDGAALEATVVELTIGVAHSYRCSSRGAHVEVATYAHRTRPALLVQEVRVENVLAEPYELRPTPAARDADSNARTIALRGRDVDVRSARVEDGARVAFVATAATAPPASATVAAGRDAEFVVVTAYGEDERSADAAERAAIDALGRALAEDATARRRRHEDAWRRLRRVGVAISESKAADALNGDRANATAYAVLSQTRAPDLEDENGGVGVRRDRSRFDGCYGGHPTLLADALWARCSDVGALDALVDAWLVTLEKRGCREAVAGGASDVALAIALSVGGLRFADRHLEFDAHPSDLHREFAFRLEYGDATRLNVSVVVEDDDKAALYASAEGSPPLFACDGGCVDAPVALGVERRRFPVKLTEPPTAILYVTTDREHAEDLHRAIHVREVAVAPPHERHVLALHKHGHSLGGLPTVFWVSICVVIVAFHLFLCRIVMTEYCDSPDKYRKLYTKP